MTQRFIEEILVCRLYSTVFSRLNNYMSFIYTTFDICVQTQFNCLINRFFAKPSRKKFPDAYSSPQTSSFVWVNDDFNSLFVVVAGGMKLYCDPIVGNTLSFPTLFHLWSHFAY